MHEKEARMKGTSAPNFKHMMYYKHINVSYAKCATRNQSWSVKFLVSLVQGKMVQITQEKIFLKWNGKS